MKNKSLPGALLALALAASALWAAASYKFPGDVTLDDGVDNSPNLRFKGNGAVSTWTMHSELDSLFIVDESGGSLVNIINAGLGVQEGIFVDPGGIDIAGQSELRDDVHIYDESSLHFYEADASPGDQFVAFKAPASLSVEETCEFENDSHFIPFTCIGTGADPYDDTPDGDGEVPDNITVTRTKCINIDPSHTTTDWLFFRTDTALALTGIDCIVDASTSVVMTLRECNSNAASCGDSEAAITCGTTNSTEASGIDDANVDAGDWLRVTRGAMTGSPTQVELCVVYTSAS